MSAFLHLAVGKAHLHLALVLEPAIGVVIEPKSFNPKVLPKGLFKINYSQKDLG